MDKPRVAFAILLSLVVLVPIALSALLWFNNFLYGAFILMVWWIVVLKHRAAARILLIPLSALQALPPYPNWLYIDNSGTYHFGFSAQSMSSWAVVGGLFIFYLAALYGIYSLCGGTKIESA